jgi:uncharacterized membrane protein
MSIPIENIVIVPFLVVFFIFWFVFSLVIIFQPHAWVEFQNRHSRKYGFEIKVFDEAKYVSVHKRAGFWLVVLGACAALIIAGYMTGFIPIF